MRESLRGIAVAVAAAAFFLGGAESASAEQVSQGRTYGGTAYGGGGELVLRRPGMPSGAYYDMKTGVKNDAAATYYYVGTRSYSSGAVENLIQFKDASGLVNQPMGLTSRASLSADTFYLLNGGYRLQPKSVEFYWPESSRAYSKEVVDYQHVFVRSLMSNSTIGLSASDARLLAYQPDQNKDIVVNWGLPNAVALSTGACGRFKTETVYTYAHNTGC